ncbi:MAG: MFS transporter [Gammaproteobacteria bacterium]|nr:MFS transporter [Gammaproteobacteria bacterium]
MPPPDYSTRDPAVNSGELRYAWYVVGVLMVCYTLSFVDRQILSLLVTPIKEDLGIGDTQIGLLQGLAFVIFYTLLGLPAGWLADRYSRRTIIATGVLLWSFMTAVCSVTRSFWSLFGARVGVGVGEATLGPSAFSLITDYFPRDRLGTALSFYSMGIFIGSGLAFVVGGAVVGAVSHMPAVAIPLLGTIAAWRLTFLIVGVPGLLVAVLMYTVREPLRRGLLIGADGAASRLSLADVAAQMTQRWRSVLGISSATIFQAMANYAVGAWLPVYFERAHGWATGQAGLPLGLMIVTFGCLGMYVGGRLCDHWQRLGRHEAPLLVAMIGVTGAGVCVVLATTASSATASLLFMAPGYFFLGLPIGSIFASIQWIFPNQVRGVAGAVLQLILNIGGLSLGPLLPGLFTDYLFHDERMIGEAVALTVGAASVAGAVLFRLSFAPYRADFARMHAQD